MLKKAKEECSSVIFITDDEKKGDWMLITLGQNLGPLPALRKEFKDFTSKDLYIYPAFRFLKLFLEKEFKEASPIAVQEVKDISSTTAFASPELDSIDEGKALIPVFLSVTVGNSENSYTDCIKLHERLMNEGYILTKIAFIRKPNGSANAFIFDILIKTIISQQVTDYLKYIIACDYPAIKHYHTALTEQPSSF